MKARRKTAHHEVWQFRRSVKFPPWVSRCVEVRDDGLYLVTRSGSQLISPGDWLVRDLDGEPWWISYDAFAHDFELVG
jgi:hypothetical protein